jgi:hypothetical protein
VGVEALLLEQNCYVAAMNSMGCTKNQIDEFIRCFKMQSKNRGTYNKRQENVKYMVKGNRMSGDWNTSLGNAVIMSCYVVALLEELSVPKTCWRILDDGDDCVLIVSKKYVPMLVDKIPSLFLKLGQEIKIESVVSLEENLEGVKFCQGKPIKLADGRIIMARDYSRAIDRFYRPVKTFKTREEYLSYLKAVSYCNYSLYSEVPILGKWFARQYNAIESTDWQKYLDTDWNLSQYKKRVVVVEHEPSMIARLSYQKAYNISPIEQCNIENVLLRISSKIPFL